MGRSIKSALLLGLAAALVPVAAAPVHAAEAGGVGIRLLDAPVDRKDDARAQVYIVDHVPPGASLSRRVEVTNLADTTKSLNIYPVAAELDATGFRVADAHTANEVSEWMTVSPATLRLAPKASAQATVTIQVPKDAAPGERYAAVVAELPATSKGPGTTVSVATRVGVRVYLDVGPGGEPASDFRIDSLTARRAKNGIPEVTATVTNTGGRAVDLSGTLTLSDGPGGLRAGPFPVDTLRTLGVKTSGDVLVKLDKSLPAGPWHARIDMQSGRLKRAATGVITFPDAAGESSPPVKAKQVPLAKNRKVLIPIAGGLIVLLLLGLFLLWFLAKKRSKRDESEAAPSQ
jgi:hypothetical protein